MKIAILGTRGIPARYGGFETFAEELSAELASRGHDVLVCNRRRFGETYVGPTEYRGVKIHSTPTVMHKYLETPLHALTSFLWLFTKRFDVVLLCNAANSPFSWLLRLRGIPFCVNVDGIERMRSKWNSLGKLWYALGERCAVWFSNRIVADARVIADYYREQYSIDPETIAYGARAKSLAPGKTLQEFGLEKDKYILYVSRLEPENNALGVVQAYSKVATHLPLVVVGDAPYAAEYIEQVKASADSRVIFTGFRFGAEYQELQSNCYCYIQATEVGGTHPALIESMAHGNAIIANGTPENYEVLSEAGLFYAKNDFDQLGQQLARLLGDPGLKSELGKKARLRAVECYSWEGVADQYELLFGQMLRGSEISRTSASLLKE